MPFFFLFFFIPLPWMASKSKFTTICFRTGDLIFFRFNVGKMTRVHLSEVPNCLSRTMGYISMNTYIHGIHIYDDPLMNPDVFSSFSFSLYLEVIQLCMGSVVMSWRHSAFSFLFLSFSGDPPDSNSSIMRTYRALFFFFY